MATKTSRKAPATSQKTPAERLLDALGPIGRFNEDHGDFGSPARMTMEQYLEPFAIADETTRLGPIEKVHLFWFAGMSCDGCSVAVTGAQAPTLEGLMMGAHPGLPRVVLHHPVVNLEAGPAYVRAAEEAIAGTLDAPYVVVLEGSISDETVPHAYGGYWAGQGEEPWGPNGEQRTVTADEWIARLAPNSAAMIAIGTCATWGGIPSAAGNPTGAMSLMDFLGQDYRSTFGVPVVNVPGCPPIGDNFTEAVAAVVYFLQGFGPLPEFDELGRPAWQFGETVHRHCVRGAYYEEGNFAKEFGDKECLVEIGCWGPVVNCNITSRGAINHHGGCMNSGGACIGCTMPGFPDKFTPFYKAPPGSRVSSTMSRILGSFIRPLREYSTEHLDREVRWDLEGHVPSGWSREHQEPGPVRELGHKFYDRIRRSTDGAKNKGPTWGKREEWTLEQDTAAERRLPGGEEEALTIDKGR